VNRKSTLVLMFCLAGCGGDTDAPPGPLTPVDVAITKLANGCLASHNADAEENYMLGAVPAKALLWSCANFAGLNRVGVEAFYVFNGGSCFLEYAVARTATDCSKRAAAPASPALAAAIEIFNPPSIQFIGGGKYVLNVDTLTTVTGNVTAFQPSIHLTSAPAHFAADLDSIGDASISGSTHIFPMTAACLADPTSFSACAGQRSIRIFQNVMSSSTIAGQQYTVTLTVHDVLSNPIGSTSFNLTAP
jgi:hypothetical protein